MPNECGVGAYQPGLIDERLSLFQSRPAALDAIQPRATDAGQSRREDVPGDLVDELRPGDFGVGDLVEPIPTLAPLSPGFAGDEVLGERGGRNQKVGKCRLGG